MCGIVGIAGREPVAERLLDGLRRLEYRGYDSAGIAALQAERIEIRKAAGKLKTLSDLLDSTPLTTTLGIAHTRWATHGQATEVNAHPHCNGRVAVVHNGIIENFAFLKEKLSRQGAIFRSQTDTEAIVHLMSYHLDQQKTPLEALQQTLSEIEGTFALAILVKGHEDLMLVARQGSPLVIGRGDGENMVGSDPLVLAPWVKDLQFLEEGDYALLTSNSVQIYDNHHNPVDRPIQKTTLSESAVSKGSYDHFMLKEIFEQPDTLRSTLQSLLGSHWEHLHAPMSAIDWSVVTRLTIVACGTSYYAASVAKYWFEIIARLSVDIDIASEFRYRDPIFSEGGVTLVISQSGETLDTLMALRLAKERGQQTIGLVNVQNSSIARMADHVLLTQAGPEIGVASTKAFTAQLMVLACLVMAAGRARGHLSKDDVREMTSELISVPTTVDTILKKTDSFRHIAEQIKDSQSVLFLGRGTHYPIASEGALKLKELSYIHAEAFPAGEIKHGPIALVDDRVPVIAIAPADTWMTKTFSNLQEVVARGAHAICFTDSKGHERLKADKISATVIEMPSGNLITAPFIYTIPMQLLAYYTALQRGADADQPRNLAKSVTVE